jgi:hypothetical protein
MKKLYALFALLFSAHSLIHAQLNIQPIIPEDSTFSNVLCYMTDTLQWYRVITPVNGMMVLYTTASINDSGGPEEFQYLGVEVLGKNLNGAFGQVYQGGDAAGTFFPYVGNEGSPLNDTSYTCCMAADTFYIRVDVSLISSSCWSYSFRWHTIPATYQTNGQVNAIDTPQFLPYNTPENGNLAFENISTGSGNGNNEWFIVPPVNGTLKLNMSIETESGVGNWMDVQPYFESLSNGIAAQYPPLGPFLTPKDTVLYWDCFTGGDTFLIKTNLGQYGDGGSSYQLSYTIVAPVFSNDSEPNDNFAEATVVNPGLPIYGQSSFTGQADDDFYEFYLPDSVAPTIISYIESSETLSAGAYIYVNIYDSSQNDIYNFYPLMGGNSQPAGDTTVVPLLAPGWYYMRVIHSSSCFSYEFLLSGNGITSGIRGEHAMLPLRVFPNPSSNTFTVDFGEARNSSISVYNTIGQLVETTLQGNERQVVFGENLPAGLYLIKASSSNGEISEGKLVKTK